jgi:hypothetical protein
MTNLPISSNSLPIVAKGTPEDAAPARSESAASGNSTAQTSTPVKDQAAETFSVLLARQIEGGWEAGLNPGKISTDVDGKAAEDSTRPAKSAQDQATAIATGSSDPAGSLAAMMLPIHIPDNGQGISPPPTARKGGIQQETEGNFQNTPGRPAGNDNALSKTGNTDPSPLTFDVVKHVAVAAGTASHAPDMHRNEIAAIPGPATAGIYHIATGNTLGNIAQTVASPINSSGWAGEFSQKIIWIGNQNNQSAELHLNPPDLGPLNVVIKLTDNQLTAQFTSPHSVVRDAVESALPKLREILAENNIMLGNATVSDQAPRDQSGQGYMNQGAGSAMQRDTSYNSTESNASLPTTTQSLPVRRHNGMLDTFA